MQQQPNNFILASSIHHNLGQQKLQQHMKAQCKVSHNLAVKKCNRGFDCIKNPIGKVKVLLIYLLLRYLDTYSFQKYVNKVVVVYSYDDCRDGIKRELYFNCLVCQFTFGSFTKGFSRRT